MQGKPLEGETGQLVEPEGRGRAGRGEKPQGGRGDSRSLFQARSDRYPGGYRRSGAGESQAALDEAHEGRARAQRQCGLASERGRSGEHRPWYWLKTGDKVRTLGWSKALKSGPTLSGSEASWPFCGGGRGLSGYSATRPDFGLASRGEGGGLARRDHR